MNVEKFFNKDINVKTKWYQIKKRKTKTGTSEEKVNIYYHIIK